MTEEDEAFVRIMREAVIKNKPQGEHMNNTDIETLELENRLLRARNERLEAEVITAPLTLNGVPLYPRREWVGLTDDEVDEILDATIGFNSCFGPETDFARAVEAKLKEKNE